MSSKYILKSVVLPNGDKHDIAIEDGLISAVSQNITPTSHVVIDTNGSRVLPGLVDLHTHLREPGREDAETVLTGSRAGAKGGFTALSAMANTSPVADTAGVVEQVYRLGQDAGYLDVFPIGAVTKGLMGESLSEIGAMADSIARVRIFSDDGNCVFDPLLMRRALEYVKKFGGVIAQHAQDPRLTAGSQMNEGEISARLGLKGWPAVAEEAIIARDVLLVDHVKSRLHICHLLLTDELTTSYDPIFKVNPPLRTSDDVHALREALAEGVIDIVATDHAPHPVESKECEWQEASFGMLGLETALSIVQKTMVETQLMTWEQVADRMSLAPARIGGYKNQGQEIVVGSAANLVVIDPSKNWQVDRDLTMSKATNTPYHGLTLPGVITHTFYQGKATVIDSVVQKIGDV